MKKDERSDYLGTKQCAGEYSIHKSTQALLRQKGMPYIQLPGSSKILYKRSELEAWLESGRNATDNA